jgi:hypothetical protein
MGDKVRLVLLQLWLLGVHDPLLQAQTGDAVGGFRELALKIGKRVLVAQLRRVLERYEIALYSLLSSRCHRGSLFRDLR